MRLPGFSYIDDVHNIVTFCRFFNNTRHSKSSICTSDTVIYEYTNNMQYLILNIHWNADIIYDTDSFEKNHSCYFGLQTKEISINYVAWNKHGINNWSTEIQKHIFRRLKFSYKTNPPTVTNWEQTWTVLNKYLIKICPKLAFLSFFSGRSTDEPSALIADWISYIHTQYTHTW